MSKLNILKVVSNRPIGSNGWLLSIDYRPVFKPGQIVAITVNNKIPARLYSICSAPGEQFLDVLFTVKPDGVLSPLLSKLSPGDEILVSEPTGEFVMTHANSYWIATGTGIAPFCSMFRSGIKPTMLIHGGRTPDDLFFRNQFERNIQYVGCCSQQSEPGIYSGRLTQYLLNLNTIPSDIYYYLCGSAEMIVDVRNILLSKGVTFENIITEIYF